MMAVDFKLLPQDKLKRSSKSLKFLCFCIAFFIIYHPVAITANSTTNIHECKISDMEIFEKISNPCALSDGALLHRNILTEQNKGVVLNHTFLELTFTVPFRKQVVEKLAKELYVKSCLRLDLPDIAKIPKDEDMQNRSALVVFRMFYESFLNHTAYAYFLAEQMQFYKSDYFCNGPDVSSVRAFAAQMRGLMCHLRLATILLPESEGDPSDESFLESANRMLNETVQEQPSCSRRSLTECQVIRSTIKLFNTLLQYLRSMKTELPKDE